MFTLKLELKSREIKTHCQLDYYTPAVDWATKYPRTEKGLIKALAAMKVQAIKEYWVESFRFKLYEGRVMHYTKEPKLIAVLDSEFNQL